MKVFLAADHAGFALKEKVRAFLTREGYEVKDCGAYELNKEDDYPDFVYEAARKVALDGTNRGIVFAKSGGGESIVANKVRGIRAVLGFNRENVTLARTHNDANVLSLGSSFVSEEEAKDLVKLFLETPFSNEERHVRRIEKIKKIEQKYARSDSGNS